MITFAADEIFEIAEQIERNGAKFYRKAAEAAPAKNREALMKLAEMEDEHEKTFQEIRGRLSGTELSSQTADPDQQCRLYLRAYAEGKVFDTGAEAAEKLTGSESPAEILLTAIGLEKDSIVFYVAMKKLVPQNLGGDKIDAIIEQEMGHIVTLKEQLAAR